MKKAVCALLAFLLVSGISLNGGADMNNEKPIREVSVHDPSIIKDNDGTYYVFGSHITTAKSTDMINWDYTARGYKREGNVHFGNLSENLKGSFKWAGEDDGDCKGGFAVWAPDVYYNPRYLWKDGSRGAYMMYYSASSTYKRSCIGLAVSKEINGVYEYVDTVIYSGFTKIYAKDENSDHSKQYTKTNIYNLIQKGRVCSYKDDWGVDDYNSVNLLTQSTLAFMRMKKAGFILHTAPGRAVFLPCQLILLQVSPYIRGLTLSPRTDAWLTDILVHILQAVRAGQAKDHLYTMTKEQAITISRPATNGLAPTVATTSECSVQKAPQAPLPICWVTALFTARTMPHTA